MNPGLLRFLVDIQRDTRVDDTLGGTTSTWTTIYSDVYANIDQASGGDIFRYGKQAENISTRITIRYNKLVRAGWRVLYGARVFDIKIAINENMRSAYTVLYCEEIV